MTIKEFYNQGYLFPQNVIVKANKFNEKIIYKGYISDMPMNMLDFHVTGISLKDMDGDKVLRIDDQILTITVGIE